MSVEEKQARSVFVGNIPHGTTEDQMKEIFSIIGPVLSFRIVFDRETGNPKGYGFAEYAGKITAKEFRHEPRWIVDADMAQSAIRNLNGFEFAGRTLRVDKASSQADELRLLHQQTAITAPTFETVQSANVTPDKVPEVIARTIGKNMIAPCILSTDSLFFILLVNLPPEQVIDLMKQMQTIIKEYPTEARNILIQHPQLTYAMLQSLVIMGLIPPSEAVNMLHKRPDLPSMNLLNNAPQAPTTLVPGFPPTLPVPTPAFPAAPTLGPTAALPIVPPPPFAPLATMNFPMATAAVPGLATAPTLPTGSTLSRTDQEKAQLLMQVLKLTEADIAQLPPEQRASIILLREQMQQSGFPPL